jgi:HSP20 family protein
MAFLEKLKKGIGIEEEVEKEKIKEKKKEEKETEREGQLVLDMYQTENALVIEAPIAGVKSDEINIFLEGDVLTIEGERKRPEEEREYLIQECYWGKFSRKIALPFEVDFDKAEATLKEGLLKIKIPKLKKAERRKIEIK